jgi:signal transduction histidine kinase
MLLQNHNAEEVEEKADRWLTKKRVSLAFIFVVYGLFFFYFKTFFIQFVETFQEKGRGSDFAYSISMAAVAMIIAGTYFYAYRFFTENFYFFISISWVANALYLIPDLNGAEESDPIYRSYRIGILLISFISTGFIWLAIRNSGERKPARSNWTPVMVLGVVLTIVDAVLIFRLDASSKEGADFFWLALWSLPFQVASFVIIWRVGDHLYTRLGDATRSGKAYRIAQTFRFYALLQFIFPFVPYLHSKHRYVLLIPFLVAQMLKVVNAVLMTGVLQSTRDREIEAANFALDESEEKLKRRNQLAELGALAASIKHDITTPLATMGGHIQKIKERFQHNKEIVGKMEKLEQSMDRIAATVDVVDIVRGDATFYDRDKFMDKASMLEIVHRAVRSVKDEKPPMLSKTFIKVEGREVFVRAFIPMLEQVVVNVIKNALEAIGEAGLERGLISIRVNTIDLPRSKYARWVRVVVEDNGCGIPPENVDRLTTLFTTRSDKKPNSGIGLFMGKKIMGIHSGRIDFKSTADQNTTVTLLLPEWKAFQKVAEEIHTSNSPENAIAPSVDATSNKRTQADAEYMKLAEVEQHSGGIV